MISTRTPLRVTLGGGGTDLESYYRHGGGFIFAERREHVFDHLAAFRRTADPEPLRAPGRPGEAEQEAEGSDEPDLTHSH